MATDKGELARLRADVKRQQRLVRAKMARAEKNNVNWDLRANRNIAPIADIKKVNRYTASQLKSVLRKQDAFLSRRNVLVGDVKGRVLPPDLVNENKKLDSRFYDKARRQWDKFKNIPAYHTEEKFGDSQTLEDIRLQRTPDTGLGSHDETNSIGNVRRRKSYSSIRDADALKAINDSLSAKLADPKYWEHKQEKIMGSVMQQLSLFGDTGLAIYDKVADMSPKARELLLTDRRFMDSLRVSYDLLKMGFEIMDDESMMSQQLRVEISDINRRIRWSEDRVNYKPKKNKPKKNKGKSK